MLVCWPEIINDESDSQDRSQYSLFELLDVHTIFTNKWRKDILRHLCVLYMMMCMK